MPRRTWIFEKPCNTVIRSKVPEIVASQMNRILEMHPSGTTRSSWIREAVITQVQAEEMIHNLSPRIEDLLKECDDNTGDAL